MRIFSIVFWLLLLCITTACSVFPGTPKVQFGIPTIWLINPDIEGTIVDRDSCRQGDTWIYAQEQESAYPYQRNYYEGRVDLDSCKPVEGAQITLTASDPWDGNPLTYITSSDQHGNFSFKRRTTIRLYGNWDRRNECSYSLHVNALGYVPFSLDYANNTSPPKDGLKGLIVWTVVQKETD
jgi:hypothetical protein